MATVSLDDLSRQFFYTYKLTWKKLHGKVQHLIFIFPQNISQSLFLEILKFSQEYSKKYIFLRVTIFLEVLFSVDVSYFDTSFKEFESLIEMLWKIYSPFWNCCSTFFFRFMCGQGPSQMYVKNLALINCHF